MSISGLAALRIAGMNLIPNLVDGSLPWFMPTDINSHLSKFLRKPITA